MTSVTAACCSAVYGLGRGVRGRLRSRAIMEAGLKQQTDPARSRKLAAQWAFSEQQVEGARSWANDFQLQGVTAAVGVPVFYAAWLRLKNKVDKGN